MFWGAMQVAIYSWGMEFTVWPAFVFSGSERDIAFNTCVKNAMNVVFFGYHAEMEYWNLLLKPPKSPGM